MDRRRRPPTACSLPTGKTVLSGSYRFPSPLVPVSVPLVPVTGSSGTTYWFEGYHCPVLVVPLSGSSGRRPFPLVPVTGSSGATNHPRLSEALIPLPPSPPRPKLPPAQAWINPPRDDVADHDDFPKHGAARVSKH